MIDAKRLKYALEDHGLTRERLMAAMGWQSETTYYSRVSGSSEWLLGETNRLIELGFELSEVIDIFYN